MQNNTAYDENKVDFNILNTNARSLKPKIPSFIDAFNELEVSLAFVTETWFANSEVHESQAEDLLLGRGIKSLFLNRDPGPRGISHGGVGVFWKESEAAGKRYPFDNPEKYEVMPVELKYGKMDKKVFAVAVYVPPGYSVARGRGCLQHLNDLILDIKNKSSNCYIVVGGDFNQWDVCSALDDYPDIREVTSPPTRNNRKIDKILLNWDTSDAACLPPLETEVVDGIRTESDHLIQFVGSKVVGRVPKKWKNVTFRPFPAKAVENFKADMEQIDWTMVYASEGSNKKVEVFQGILEMLVNEHFPYKTIRVLEDGLPWINEVAIKKINRKRAVFKSEGRSERWVALESDLDEYLARRQEVYLERQRDKMTGASASREFYRNVKNYSSAEKPKTFNVRDLFPDVPEQEVADKTAEYFNRISAEFRALHPCEVPSTYHRDLPFISEEMVEQRLLKARKPNSTVHGDLPPKLIVPCARALSRPLADIYRCIISTFVWPIKWKREYVTVIPKKSTPRSLSELRNISCTQFFSKVFESFVLQFASEEITLKENQYGGIKGCSTAHLLINVWQDICENAEDYRSATLLTAIDYSKAFNRLSFQHCLKAFKAKGASSPIIKLIATFLTNRQMAVRVGDSWSEFLPVTGGCPQGSILGVFLFNVTTDDLEDGFLRQEADRVGEELRDQRIVRREPEPIPEYDRSIIIAGEPETSSPSANPPLPNLTLSPIGTSLYRHSDMIIHFNNYAVNIPQPPSPHYTPQPEELPVGTQVIQKKAVKVYKYVDDNLVCERVNFGNVPVQVVAGKQLKIRKAEGTENAFKCIKTEAGTKGMAVNNDKTTMLCVSDSLNYLPCAFIEDGNSKIESVNSMKLLGFDFSDRPTVAAHVRAVCRRMKRKYWSLRHLKEIGFNDKELVEVYSSSVRPTADYCSVVYHSMLTDEQDEMLENAQVGALRAIFGPKISGRKLREKAGLTTLRKRRIEQCDKFANKCLASERFRHWFPLKEGRISARSSEKYKEFYARCDRLKDSPLFYMRRRLNGKDGKKYGERYRIYRES